LGVCASPGENRAARARHATVAETGLEQFSGLGDFNALCLRSTLQIVAPKSAEQACNSRLAQALAGRDLRA